MSVTSPNLQAVTVGLSSVSIFAQHGVPTGKVAREGSLYVNTAGSSSTTVLYVNTDGDSTWIGVGAL
jgi:hypothetical protein